jgi:hypothetical protein
MTVTHAIPEPYSSLDAIRQANDELISNFPEDVSSWAENECRSAEARTVEFIARVVETGTFLDVPADRKVAQGLINYWAARPYTASADNGAAPLSMGRVNTLLKPFDAALVRPIAERSDALFLALDPQGQSLMRQILLHLLRISHEASASSPKIMTSLCSADEAKRGIEIIERLRAADAVVVRSNDQGYLVELRYEALVRHWQRLRDWIDERVKFREAASFWVRTGRDNGALLGVKLAKSAKQYGDLSDLEGEFVRRSLTHTTQQRFALAAAAALLMLISPLAAWWIYSRVYVPWQLPGKLATAKSRDMRIETRVQAIRWLARARERVDLSDVSLKANDTIDLKALTAPSKWNFKRAELTNVDLGRAVLPGAQFTESTIVDSHFDKGAQLEDADFTRAKISNTSFFESVLSRVRFDGAQLCHVDLSETDVNDGSFLNIRYDDFPNFKRTAWWLASGWTLQQVDALTKRFGGRNRDIPSFGRELDRFEKRLEGSQDRATLEYVKAQDGIAWTYATYGLDLDKAEAASRKARDGIANLKGMSDSHTQKMESYTADTLGYILLQKGQIEEALALLRDAAGYDKNPGATFRYALALNKKGDEEEAVKKLNSAMDNHYSPSHELYLLRDSFSGRLETALEEQLPKPEAPPPGGWCH